jgi:hypothetical protein
MKAEIVPVYGIRCGCGHILVINHVNMDDVTCVCGRGFSTDTQRKMMIAAGTAVGVNVQDTTSISRPETDKAQATCKKYRKDFEALHANGVMLGLRTAVSLVLKYRAMLISVDSHANALLVKEVEDVIIDEIARLELDT